MTATKIKLKVTSGPSFRARVRPGIVGPPNSLSVGTVEFGSEAGVTISGEAPNQVINFQIPRTIVFGEPRQITDASAVVAATDEIIAIVRSGPTATGLMLGPAADRNGLALFIKDLSTGITDPTGHTITITPNGAETIDGAASHDLFVNSVSKRSAILVPSEDLNGWYVI